MSLLAIYSHCFYSWKSSWVKFYILSHHLTVISLRNYCMSFACVTFEGWEDARTVYLGHVIVAWMRSAGRTLEFWVVPSFSDIVSLTSGGYPILLCRSLAACAVSFCFVNLASLSVTDCAYCRSLQIAKSHICSLLSYRWCC